MTSSTTSDEPAPAAPIIQISHPIEAQPERVFDAWLDPAMIGRFMFGPHLRDEQIVSLDNDPRVGGRFHYKVMRARTLIDHTGTYREFDRPHRLVFTWGVNEEQGDSSVVTLAVTPQGGGSLLTLTHALHPDWAAYAERTHDGWVKIVGDLAAALA